MSFHSLEYMLFLPAAVAAFFLTPHRWRWAVIVAASVLFYASWRIDFLALLLFSTFVDYACGLALPRAKGWQRHALMAASLTCNLGLLLFFKFVPGATQEWVAAAIGYRTGESAPLLFLLPLGISFYTFQTLSYTIDVYRGKRAPERHLGYFTAYVMYFPQLIAGPIERYHRLMPQLRAEQHWDWGRAGRGGAMILLGLFKKLVIADGLGAWLAVQPPVADGASGLQAISLSLATVYRFFADLSGYADIALGSALLMGIQLTQNFERPFAAASIGGFWRRWHISVTRWFQDYMYLPLAKRLDRFPFGRALTTLVTLVAIGIWHGATTSWMVIGLSAGVLLSTSNLVRKRLAQVGGYERGLRKAFDLFELAILWIYLLFMGAIIGQPSFLQGLDAMALMSHAPAEIMVGRTGALAQLPLVVLAAIAALEIFQWLEARRPVHDRLLGRGIWPARFFYLAVIAIIMVFGSYDNPDFLYFAF